MPPKSKQSKKNEDKASEKPEKAAEKPAEKVAEKVEAPAEKPAAAQPAADKKTESLPSHGQAGTKYERTFIAVKPDGVQRGLVGEITKRFEQKGFKLVAAKLLHPTVEKAAEHYSDLKSKPFFKGLVDYFASGPIFAMVWEGKDVILSGRELLGATNPAASKPGTIRGDYAQDVGRNVCHGSDGPAGAEKEINFWFKPDEVVSYTFASAGWIFEK